MNAMDENDEDFEVLEVKSTDDEAEETEETDVKNGETEPVVAVRWSGLAGMPNATALDDPMQCSWWMPRSNDVLVMSTNTKGLR